MFKRIALRFLLWWKLRELEGIRAFLRRQDQEDPQVSTLLPRLEQRIRELRAEQARLAGKPRE